MRLLTYDRGGARRLGAWVGGAVVDVPDAVGHPAFPTTLEALVARNGGTMLDAAVAALAVPEYLLACAVPSATVLSPLLLPDLEAGTVMATGEELPWPAGAAAVECRPELACVIGRAGRRLRTEGALEVVFGYTLVNAWTARHPERRSGSPVAVAMGPVVATPDDVDLASAVMTVTVDGDPWSEGPVAWTEAAFARTLADASAAEGLRPGEVYAAQPSNGSRQRSGRGPARRLEAGALVEVEVTGLGVLRTRIGRPRGLSPAGPSPSPTTSRTRRSPRRPALRPG